MGIMNHPMREVVYSSESRIRHPGDLFGEMWRSLLASKELAWRLTVRDISGKAIANLEYDAVRHLGPTFHGDTLYARSTVLSTRPSEGQPDRGIVEVETVATNQRDEPVLSFRRSVLVPRRPAGHGSAQ